jgi:hypothetical protein
MIDHRRIVGGWFEEKISRILNLRKTNGIDEPDRISKDGKFYVEAKASSYLNGGVIKREQLEKFNGLINAKRFYAFGYHSITKNMMRDYNTEKSLRTALDKNFKSVYLFPFSIVKAFYENSKESFVPGHFSYVLMREHHAKEIFLYDLAIWDKLKLDYNKYGFYARWKINIMTNQRNLEKDIVDSLNEKACRC